MADVEDLQEHWRDEPPLAACVRAYLGVKSAEPSVPEATPELTEEQWEQLKLISRAEAERDGRVRS